MRKTKKALASLAIAGMVLSMAPMSVFAATTTNRISDADRVGTAIAIAANGWTSSDNVIVVPADDANMVDALAAAPLAGQLNAPILVTYKGALDPKVQQKIVDLKAKNVYAIGALSADTVASLKAISGVTVTALQGTDRTDTAALVAAKLTSVKGSFVVAYDGKADALSAASYAAANGYSIVIANPDGTIPAGEAAYQVAPSYTVGGQVTVAGATALAGADRYATNDAVVNGLTYNYDKVYVANGESLVDALAGAPLAAQTKSPIVLADATHAATGANDNLTSSSQVIALGGTGAVSDSVLAKVAYQAPATLEVQSVSATNLKQVVVTFSKAIDADKADASDFSVDDSGNSVSGVAVSDDGLTATLTMTNALDNDTDYTLTVDGVQDLSGNKMDKVENDFTVKDYSLPEVQSVEFTGPHTAKLVFSEPINASASNSTYDVSIDDGIYSATIDTNQGTNGYSGKNVYIDLGTELNEGSHTFKVSGFQDYVPYKMITKTLTVNYSDVTAAPTVSVKKASQTEVTLTFDRPVKGLSTDSFYQTYSAWHPVSIEDKDGNAIASTDTYVDQVVLKFTDPSNSDNDKPLPVGNDKIVVVAETDNVKVQDRWGNELGSDVTLTANVTADNDAPTISKLKVDDEKTLKVYFSEEVNASDATDHDNIVIKDSNGDVIPSYDYTLSYPTSNNEDHILTITFDEKQDPGTYSITLEAIADTSISENKLATVTEEFAITDKSGIDLSDVSVKTVDGVLYVEYPEAPATTGANSALAPENYAFGTTSSNAAELDSDNVKISMFTSKIVKIEFKDSTVPAVNNHLLLGRIADADGNLSVQMSQDLTVATDVGPIVTAVKRVDDNKIELTVNQEIKSVKASGVVVNANGTATTVGAISFANDGDSTVISVTLKAGSYTSDDTTGFVNNSTIEIAADTIKGVTGSYMPAVTITNNSAASYGTSLDDTEIATVVGTYSNGVVTDYSLAFKDGIAPTLLQDSNDDYRVYAVDSNSDNLIDTIYLKYSEAINANSVSKYTYAVGGYKVTAAALKSDDSTVVKLTVENSDSDVTNDLDATPSVTQQYSIEDTHSNKYTVDKTVEAFSHTDVSTSTTDAYTDYQSDIVGA